MWGLMAYLGGILFLAAAIMLIAVINHYGNEIVDELKHISEALEAPDAPGNKE